MSTIPMDFSSSKRLEPHHHQENGSTILTWNVNGIRSVGAKGFLDWFAKMGASQICLQETKAIKTQVTEEFISPLGYSSHWFSAKKPGYSGVMTYSKQMPLDVVEGIEFKEADQEGRVITLSFKDYDLVNAYFPNSQRDGARLSFKIEFCNAMFEFLESRKKLGRHVVLCGDYNIAHKEIDLKNPKSNQNNAGFLPEERAWMDFFLSKGWKDAFRHFTPDPGHYTWWSYRPGVREKNIGWRIDYHCVSESLTPNLEECEILCDVYGSDHCPVKLVLSNVQI